MNTRIWLYSFLRLVYEYLSSFSRFKTWFVLQTGIEHSIFQERNIWNPPEMGILWRSRSYDISIIIMYKGRFEYFTLSSTEKNNLVCPSKRYWTFIIFCHSLKWHNILTQTGGIKTSPRCMCVCLCVCLLTFLTARPDRTRGPIFIKFGTRNKMLTPLKISGSIMGSPI